MSSPKFDEAPTELIHCLEFKPRTDGSTTQDDVRMVKSQDYFATKEPVIFGSLDRSAIVNFVTKETFMLAAEVGVPLYVSCAPPRMFVCIYCQQCTFQLIHMCTKINLGS